MCNESETSLLASFATIKTLNDAKKYSNPYQMLAEFVRYLVGTHKIFVFSAVEMKNQLNANFGFDIPEAVVKSSCKLLDFIVRRDNQFVVDRSRLSIDRSFAKAKADAERSSTGDGSVC